MKGMNEKAGPKISIVIANYNYGRYLRQCIDSCLSQTYPPHEIIVVDDGSTDDSRIILKEHESHPLVRLILQDNQGQEVAMQRGLDEAAGDWIMGLDSDDCYDSSCLEEIARVADVKYSWIYFKGRTIGSDGVCLGGVKPIDHIFMMSGCVIDEWFIRGAHPNFPPLSFNCFSRKYLSSIRLYPNPLVSMRVGLPPDLYLKAKAPLYGEVFVLPKILGSYRVHQREEGHAQAIFHQWSRLHGKLEAEAGLWQEISSELKRLRPGARMHPAFYGSISHWEQRLVSLLYEPESHAFPKDAVPWLLWQNLRILWTILPISLDRKLASSIKWLVMILMPRKSLEIYQKKHRHDLKQFLGSLIGRQKPDPMQTKP